MSRLPWPDPGEGPIGARIMALDAQVGRARFVEVCVDLLGGADRTTYVPELRYLSGHEWSDDDPVRDPAVWKDYWVRPGVPEGSCTAGAMVPRRRWSRGSPTSTTDLPRCA